MSHKITLANGNKTLFALRRGYIQVSKNPASNLYLTYEDELFIVKGWNSQGRRIRREFTFLSHARTYLENFS